MLSLSGIAIASPGQKIKIAAEQVDSSPTNIITRQAPGYAIKQRRKSHAGR